MVEKQAKKKQRRGIRFPMHPLNEALRVARIVLDQGGGTLNGESLAIGLGIKVSGSTFGTKSSSAKRFGLIERDNNEYKITSLAQSILRPTQKGEDKEALKEAFLNFPIFRELHQRYTGGKLPNRPILENIFQRQYGVSDVSKTLIYDVFVESGKFAGMISETEEGLFCGYPEEIKEETGNAAAPAPPKTINRNLVDLLENIGALRVVHKISKKSKDQTLLKYIESITDELLKNSLDLASELNLSACKMSLKITLNRLGTEGFEKAAQDFVFIEDGLKEDLKLKERNAA